MYVTVHLFNISQCDIFIDRYMANCSVTDLCTGGTVHCVVVCS